MRERVRTLVWDTAEATGNLPTLHNIWVGRLSEALQPPIQIPVQLVSPSRDKLGLESPSPQYLPVDMESSL